MMYSKLLAEARQHFPEDVHIVMQTVIAPLMGHVIDAEEGIIDLTSTPDYRDNE